MKKLFSIAAVLLLTAAPIGAKAENAWEPTYSHGSSTSLAQSVETSCPYGTKEYTRTFLFGLIKGRTMCLTDYEAESLSQQRVQNFQQNLQNIQQNIDNSRPRSCYTNMAGRTAYANCY
jgi:hypothetical protein